MKNVLLRLQLQCLLVIGGLWISHSVSAQRLIANQINQLKEKATPKSYRPFLSSPSTARMAADTAFVEGAKVYRFRMNQPAVAQLQAEGNSFIEISLPISATQTIDLELVPFSIFGPNFKVKNSKNEVVPPQDLGVFYQGIVKGDNQSLASISIINGEISGIISQKSGNLNLGREGETSNYILFNENDLKQKSDFVCGVAEAPVKAMGQNVLRQAAVTNTVANVACGSVEIYIEADSALYVAQGATIAGAVNYVNTIFSKVATLYANESLSVVISEIKVWNTTDPYANSSSTLSTFRTTVGTTFNGRLAHLMSARNLGGGVAYLDVLCTKSYAHGYSGNLNNSHPALPTYSWNVEVMTHELGHNFGSPHTQSCTWPGGAIDNCYTTEGGCPPGPAPTNGGTIMSYCHLTSTGINFANGFGTLPGNLIRQRAQDCLGSAVAPTNLTVLELYNTMALVSWSSTSGLHTVEYRPVGSSTWISAGTSGNKSRYLSPLTANTAYEWRVNANCSAFVTGTFTTNSTPSPGIYCTPSHSEGCTYDIFMTNVVLGGTTLNSNSDCSSGGYTFSPSPIKSLVKGQATSFTVQLSGYYNASQLAIWVDLNKDTQFQSNEKLFTTTAGQTQAFTGNITVPTTAINGQTRIRIIVNFSSAPTNPCGSYTYGETEDYYVNITCPAPTAYNVTGGGSFCSTGTGVVVGLSGSQAGVSYQLKRGSVAVGTALNGTGAALDFGTQSVAGVYTVEATPTGCGAFAMSGSATVAVVSAPTLTFSSSTNPTSCGGSNGSITFSTTNVSNGTYSVAFSSTGTSGPQNVSVASNAFTLTNLSVGTYSNFTLTANGCTATDATSRTISNPLPVLTAGAVTNASVCGTADGSIAFTSSNVPSGNYQLSYTGAGSPKTVAVSNNSFMLSGLLAGTYSNFSLAANGCTGSDATSKTVSNSALPTITAGTIVNPTTCGGANGSIAFSTTNIPDGTYQLNYTGTGSPKMVTEIGNGFVLTGLTAGVYSSFSITFNGCTATDVTSKTVSNPPNPVLTAGAVTNASVCGTADGNIAFTTSNVPSGNYQLSYTGAGSPKTVAVSSNSFTLSGLLAGTYSNFSLTSNGCTGSDATSKTVGNAAQPTLTAGAVVNTTTCGGTNGSISFTTSNIANGIYQLSYTGSGSPKSVTVGSNVFTLSGLPAGNYSNFSMTVNGCTATDATSKTVSNPPNPVLTAGAVTNASVCGTADGSIAFTTLYVPSGNYQLSYTGAGSPKTVAVSNNSFMLSGLLAGTYSNFSLTSNGCTGTDATSKTVGNAAQPTLTAGAVVNTTTCGGTNGSISFTTSNIANGDYQLSYTGSGSPKSVTVGSNVFILSGLSAGNYSNFSMTVNGCTATDATSKTVSNPPNPVLTAGAVTNASVCGTADGSIAFTTLYVPSGNYQLSYTGAGSPKTVAVSNNSFMLPGLLAGTYSNFSLTSNGCTGSDATSKTVGNAAQPTLTAGAVVNTTTCGGTNGSISFTTSNIANGDYQLSYTGSGSPKSVTVSSNVFTLSGLPAGNYSNFSMTVNGCTATDATSKMVSNPPNPVLTAGAVTNASVCGTADGSIAFTTLYVPSGNYQLSYTGAGSPKTVAVSNNSFMLLGLLAGTYSNFSLTSNGCTGTDATSKTVGNAAQPTLTAGAVVNTTTCGGTNGSISFTTSNIANGDYQLSYTGSGSPKSVTVSSNVFTLSGLPAGSYSNFSMTVNGCTATDAAAKTVSNPSGITLTAGAATALSSCGGTDGSIAFTTVGVSNGSYQLTYTGTGSPKTVVVTNNTFALSGLPFGTYSNFSLTVNSCLATDNTSKNITNPPAPTLVAGAVTALTLCGGTDGSIAFTTVNIPNGNYQVSFTGAGSPKAVTVSNNAFVLPGLSQGTYSNFAINVNGCNAIDVTAKIVNNPPQPTLLAGTITPVSTCGASDGSIAFTTTNIASGNYQLTYSGTGSPKVITITNNSFILANLSAGAYSNFNIIVNGCTATEPSSKTVNSPSAIGLTATNVTNPTTCNGTNGSIAFTTVNIPSGNYQLTFTGGVSPKTVSIANNAFVLSNLAAGTFKNFSISFNSCVALDTTTKKLSDPTPPNAGTISGSLALCVGIPVTLTTSGTSGGTWSSATPTVATIQPASGVVTGNSAGSSIITYSITTNGCTASTTATVSVDVPSVGGNLGGSTSVCGTTNSSVLTLSQYTGTVQKWQWSLNPDFSPATDVFNSLTSVTVTNLAQTTYYRAIIQNGVCNAINSPTATITVNPFPTVGFSGPTSIVVGGTTNVFPTTGGTWISNNAVKASVTNAGVVTGVEAGTSTFTFTDTATGCKNSTSILVVTSASPCNQSITLVSPTNDISSGTAVRQTNLGIDASNRVTGTSTNVTYQSGSSVTLKPGFQADAGTVFKAQIGGCN